MKVRIKIAGKQDDVKELAEELNNILRRWNRLAKGQGREKASIEIAEVCKLYNNVGKVH